MQLYNPTVRLILKESGILPEPEKNLLKKSNHEKAPVLHHFYYAFQCSAT